MPVTFDFSPFAAGNIFLEEDGIPATPPGSHCAGLPCGVGFRTVSVEGVTQPVAWSRRR